MSTVTTNYTPEDLLKFPKEGPRYELVDGALVEKKMSMESDLIAGNVFYLLKSFCTAHALGIAFPETYYQCFPDEPGRVRRPDTSFIRQERLPPIIPRGHCRIAPDIAVEVTSPNDLYEEIETKVDEYLDAGVQLVWVVHPRNRTVQIRRPGRPGSVIGPDEELSGEDVLPGFRCRVADLFPSPWPATTG